MEQSVLTRNQGDEGTEIGRLDHRSQVPLTHLGHRRIGDVVDRRPRRFGGSAVRRTDVDRAVVLNGDVGAGVFLDLVDDLALRPDHLADLVDGDLHRDNPRCRIRHLVRGIDRLVHHVENRHPRVPSLGQSARENIRRNPVQLGVQLQGGDELAGAGDLEVHVAVGILSAQDVG